MSGERTFTLQEILDALIACNDNAEGYSIAESLGIEVEFEAARRKQEEDLEQ